MTHTSPLFHIDPEFEKRIHPYALGRFRNWQDEVEREVPQLAELTDSEIDADIEKHLTEDEQAEAKACWKEITDWLVSCTDPEKTVSTYSLPQYNTWIIRTMSRFKQLIRTVYQQKEAEEEAERERAERDAKWHEGFEVLGNGLWEEAKHYLGERERDKFHNAVIEAIELHIETGGKYEEWELPFDYRWYKEKIKNEKAKEQAKLRAKTQAVSFNQELNHFTEKFKASLSSKQNTAKYFNKDIRLSTGDLYECLSPEQQDKLMDIVRKVAEPRLQQLIPEAHRDFVSWENSHYYRLRPIADYVFEDIPCLAFSFVVEAVLESEIQLIPSQKVFGDFSFDLPVINYEGYRAVLQKPEFLGYFYQYLSPIELPSIPWQTIPLNLLTSLTQGKIVPQGAKVIVASEAEVIYKVEKFDKLIDIPASFQACLEEMQGFEGMVTAGVIGNQTARIIIEQTLELKSAPIQETAATEQPPDFTKEQFIEKLTGLGVPEAHAKILSEKIPEGLGLDGAVRWALREYQRIVAENTTFESYYH